MDKLAVPAVDDDNQVLDGTNASKSGLKDEPSTDVKQATVVSKKPKVVRRFTDAEKLRAIAVAKKKSVAMASQTLGIPERNVKRWLHIPDEQLTKMK